MDIYECYAYNQTFQRAIGGYPKLAIVSSLSAPELFYLSTVDGNMTDPDLDLSAWEPLAGGSIDRLAEVNGISRRDGETDIELRCRIIDIWHEIDRDTIRCGEAHGGFCDSDFDDRYGS